MKSGLDNKLTWIDYCNIVFIFVMAAFLFLFVCALFKYGPDGLIDQINHNEFLMDVD